MGTTVAPAHPWRKTARTLVQATIAGAAIAPGLYSAATHHDPTQASGWAAAGLAIAAGITRVMALPAVEVFLRRFVPWLSSSDVATEKVVVLQPDPDHPTRVVAGDAAVLKTGTPLPPTATARGLTGGQVRDSAGR